MEKVAVLEDGEVVGMVKINTDLDYWDGHNYTCGSTGLHMGYTRLKKSGKFVLIHTSQWEGSLPSAEVVTQTELLAAAASTGHLSDVLKNYPELVDGLDGE